MSTPALRATDRVVVVGGGVGGVTLVSALRAGGFEGELVLVDRAELPYDRPPLSKDYLAGSRDLESIALLPRRWYAEHRVELVGPAEVTSVEPGQDAVEVVVADGRRWSASHVVLSVGGRASLPPVPGLDVAGDAGLVHVLRDVDDADRLRRTLLPGVRLLVLGGGLIGAETAATARTLGCEVVVVDPLAPPLLAAAGEVVASWLHAQHATHGVRTVSARVARLEVADGRVRATLEPGADGGEVELDGEFDAVLVGAGMSPRTGLAQGADVEVDRGVMVDDEQRTTHPRILAVGDVAQHRGRPRAEHWDAAQDDARRAAAALLGTAAPPVTAHWWWSDRYDCHVEGAGQMPAADDETTVVTRGTPGDGPFSVFALRDGAVVGAVAVDDSQAVRAARRLIDRGARVDAEQIADASVDLRRLLRR